MNEALTNDSNQIAQNDAEKLFELLRCAIRNDADIGELLKKYLEDLMNGLCDRCGLSISRDPREKAKVTVLEALKQKDLVNGRNLLMYAAFEGALTSFNTLVDEILKRVRKYQNPESVFLPAITTTALANFSLSTQLESMFYNSLHNTRSVLWRAKGQPRYLVGCLGICVLNCRYIALLHSCKSIFPRRQRHLPPQTLP